MYGSTPTLDLMTSLQGDSTVLFLKLSVLAFRRESPLPFSPSTTFAAPIVVGRLDVLRDLLLKTYRMECKSNLKSSKILLLAEKWLVFQHVKARLPPTPKCE